MCPVLLKIGPLTIYWYGAMVALGFVAGLWLALTRSQKYGLSRDKVSDLCFYVLICGLAGARVLFVFTDLKSFIAEPLEIFKVWHGGLVFYGGLIGGLAAGIWFAEKNKLSFLVVADLLSPSLVIAHVFGRIGCFLNGCCYGKVNRNMGIIFPAVGDNLPRLPVQLFESAGLLVIFAVLMFLSRKTRKPGDIFTAYLVLYSILRFNLEFLRDDDRGMYFWGLSQAQFISLIALAVAVVLWSRRAGRKTTDG